MRTFSILLFSWYNVGSVCSFYAKQPPAFTILPLGKNGGSKHGHAALPEDIGL